MICVDELREIKDESISAHAKGCFLFVDNNNTNSLHEFARALKLSRDSFKDDSFLSRYVINESKRKSAISKGAKEVTFKKTVQTCRDNKAHNARNVQTKRRIRENDVK